MLDQDDDDMNKDWANILLKLGVQGGIAAFLVWRLASGLDDLSVRMQSTESQHSQIILQLNQDGSIMAQLLRTNERVLGVLQQTCIQQARGQSATAIADAQSRCFGTQ